jgi:hypothetical protein
MAERSLVEKVVELAGALRRARIPHGFGGALAFAYYGEPRSTVDIDLNLFVGTARYERVMETLGPLGVARARNADALVRDGQARLWWGRTPLDLFFSYDPLHDAMRRRVRTVPFSDTTIPILGPEHLLTTKVVFDRAKDWIDIEQMLVAVPALDLEEAHGWLERLLGPDDQRVRHLHDLEVGVLGAGENASRRV